MQVNLEHAGWRSSEAAILFDGVREARRTGRPLKAVFEDVAKETGRKPNSIRNYYYAKLKEDDSLAPKGENAAFVPFTEEEIDMLLKKVLTSQAKGISVRACTLAMGNGDTKAMLRYQNKYRSIVKNDPARIKAMLHKLAEEKQPACDPYTRIRHSRAGRPSKRSSLVDVLSGVVNDLDQVDGLDVTAFFESLGAHAISASRGAKAMQAMENLQSGEKYIQIESLREKVEQQEKELFAQRERFGALLSLYRQLIDVNRQFLGMTGVSKMSSLSSYIHDLARNVEDCERTLPGLM